MNMTEKVKLIGLNEKFRKGDSLTTPELLSLRDFYLGLATDLTVVEDMFALARMEAYRRLSRLNDYLSARGLDTKEVKDHD